MTKFEKKKLGENVKKVIELTKLCHMIEFNLVKLTELNVKTTNNKISQESNFTYLKRQTKKLSFKKTSI